MRRRGSACSRNNEQSIDNQSTYSKLINETNVNLSHFEKFVKVKLEHRHQRTSSLVDSLQEGPKKIYSFKMPFLTKDLQLSSRQEAGGQHQKTNGLESEEDVKAPGSKGKLNLLVSKEIFKRNSCIHDNSQVKNLTTRRSVVTNSHQPYPIDSLSELEPKYQDAEHENNLSTYKMKHNASRTTNFTVMTRNQLNESSRNFKFMPKVNSHTMSLVGSTNDIFSSKISPKEHQAMLECAGTIILPQDSACPSLVLPEAVTHQQHKQILKYSQDECVNEFPKCLSEMEVQQKLEKLVHRENSSRGSSRRKPSHPSIHEASLDHLAVQLQKEAEFNQIHKELVMKLKAHIASPKTKKIQNKNVRSKRVSRENSFSISRVTVRHMRSSSVGETYLDKSISMVQNRQSVLDRSFKQKLVKQNTSQLVEAIPEWLKQRDDFKGAFGLRGDELYKAIIATCEKLPYSRSEEEIKAVKGWLHNVKLFQHLPEFMIYNIGSKIKHQFYRSGEILCKEGEPEDCLFIIYDGIARSYSSGIEGDTYQMFDAIGQSPLESSSNRPMTLIADTDVSALKLARHEYRNILEQHLTMERTAYFFLLGEIDVLKDLDEKKRKAISSNLRSKRFTKGQIIYEEGEEPEKFYIIRSGKVQLESKVRVEKENIWPTGTKVWEKTKHIRDMKFQHDIKAKQHFGEVEMIDGCTRRNTVSCAEDAELLVLRSSEFFGVFSKDDQDRLRMSVQANILEETLDLKHRVIREEGAKKKIMDSTVKTLLNLKESSRERNIFRPQAHSLQPLAKKIQNKYHSSIQQNTIKTLKAHEILHNNPYGG